MFVLYEVLLILVFIIALPWFAFTGFLRGKYLRSFRQRLGGYRGRYAAHDVWVHAVSVGEVVAAKPVIDRLLERRPELEIVVTTTTTTGQATARRFFSQHDVTYFPFDFSFSVHRFLARFGPRVAVMMETEIWPNTLRIARNRGVRLLLANARLSDRSFPRYRRLRPFIAPILRFYDSILARETRDRDRFVQLGAESSRVHVAGNVKFDYQPDREPLEFEEALLSWLRGRPLLVIGSTAEGEDEEIIPQLSSIVESGYLVVLAPRRPERFEIVGGLLDASSLNFARRTQLDLLSHGDDVLLLDSIGELGRMYRHARAAFVGGSLVPLGGHNPIEAVAVGVPVSFGPHMSNFREIASLLCDSGGATQVIDAAGLVRFAQSLLDDPNRHAEMSRRGRQVIESNRGAAEITARAIEALL